jgi:hypothetical protein
MPYIATYDNRYIAEHTCGRDHYGDMTMVRECCVEDAKSHKASVLRNAMTTSHPSYVAFVAAWNSLTDAEMHLVGDIRAVYDNGPAGFKEKS